MKKLIVCCDGSWNTPTEMEHGLPAPTNVTKLYYAVERSDSQLPYYHPGVGTGRSLLNKALGGGVGEGLDQNIKSAYRWLGSHYVPGDQVFLFGFSRGAYTARSLCGLISKQGLLDLSADMDPSDVWKRVDDVFAAYRMRNEFSNPDNYPFYNARSGQSAKETTPIFFIGVWDTVGALGLPEDLAVLWLLDNPDKYRFHDTALSPVVANARHAVALDEKRATFAPTLWSDFDPNKTKLVQLWFPGTHCDVGGGHVETGLSDGALKWMMDEAETCGLTFRPGIKNQIKPDPLAINHDSCTGIFKALKTKPRSAPSMETGGAILHQSTAFRHANVSLLQGDYWPGRAIAQDGATMNVYAGQQWNWTGIYLEANKTYRFTAEGEWIDGKEKFTPAGHELGGFHLQDLLHLATSATLGEAETMFKAVTGREADFWWTRRDEHAPWFALMGFVANDAGMSDNTLSTGETFMIGESATFTPKFGGYLYCYANDAWQAYGNNRGSVALTVKRTP